MDKEYNFQILLPNGTSFHLKLRIPEPIMPFRDFIKRVEEEYIRTPKQSGSHSLERKQEINWKGGNFLLVDADDMEIQNVVNFMTCNPQECHILRLQDGLQESATTFENMWDLTPDTDILKELPHEYTFLTALAHLIDNSLQAVWSNEGRDIKHISVDVDDDMISIFDTGPGMDGSDENSIVKWGKMGASLHIFEKEQAIGGKPPYLKPFFGMFGFGGPITSMQLGRRALVSSKTKDSKKVYTLNLDRDALLSGSNWKTKGYMRDPEKDEISRTPHGSFTKIEISESKSKLNTYQLQCKLKDLYFPYIQYDDTKSGKTIMPVKFEVNGVDLAEIQGGEIAITNLHSCNGPDFVLQLQFSYKQDNMNKCKSFDSKTYTKANARLKCVYFPMVKGKENIDRILEGLESEKCGTTENFETFSRVSIRRLGRLLPDAHWGMLPFMDLKQKRGDTAQLLKRCCMRVKCFIETDAGFNPTSSKTDLAHHSPFTTALRNFGNKPLENENDIKVQIYKDGNLLNPSQLKKDYEDWIVQMHSRYDDDEADCGEDQPVFVVSPANKKTLRISSEVARVHKSIMRNGRTWKCGQRIRLLKGACAEVQKNNVYATIEYFLLEGLQDESGGEAQIICRPSSLSDEKGCILSVNDEDTNLDMCESLSIPLSVIDAGKCIGVERTEWENHMDRRRQRSPPTVELLDAEQCQELEVNGVYEKGTTSAAIKYSEGIVCTCDSRGTCYNTVTKDQSIMDTRNKFRVISSKSNLLHMGVGEISNWEYLAETVANEVKDIEETSNDLVTVEEALKIARKYLQNYLKKYPKNELVFGGILVGWLPSKVYQAYQVLLMGTRLLDSPSLDAKVPYLVLGSGADHAELILKKLARNQEMPERTARRAAISTMVYASFNNINTGGPIHVFVLRNGENVTRDGGHEILDPCAVHLQRSSFFSENILLMLLDKNQAGPTTRFESFISSWPDVICTSRVVAKKKYFYYRLFYKTSQHAATAFDMLIQNEIPPLDVALYPKFKTITIPVGGGMSINVLVQKCSKEILEFMTTYE